jgi:hypothetical protein
MLDKLRNRGETEKYRYKQDRRKPLSQLLIEYEEEEYDELNAYQPRKKKRLNLAEAEQPNEYKDNRPRQHKRDSRKNPLRKDKWAFEQ